MTKISQGNKTMTRKITATNNKVLVRTGSLLFFKKYWQPIIKFWSVPLPVHKAVRKSKETGIINRFFSYFAWGILFKARHNGCTNT